ncbi:hypothetical protein ACFYUJ_38950 [Streptomyces sp. NPDC004520]|uniref:hypothetical protein n=1 Tax=Streptomyces sp. NPDC004520 TaxID=3364702 RepID=UPI0036B26E87
MRSVQLREVCGVGGVVVLVLGGAAWEVGASEAAAFHLFVGLLSLGAAAGFHVSARDSARTRERLGLDREGSGGL